MSWTCYSCGTKNPKSADTCKSCGGTVAAPPNFYVKWVFGGALFFFVFYLAGTLSGGVLVEAAANPDNETILAEANSAIKEDIGKWKSYDEIEPKAKTAATAVATAKAKENMSVFLKGFLYWVLPVVLFILCGIIVGFISDGKTIFEPGLGSVLGQGGGFIVHMFVLKTGLPWLALVIGLIPGFALAALGAWLGEIIQDKKEQAGGITG